MPASATDIGIALDVAIAALKTPPGPNWEEAPEWAQWWVTDINGNWYWCVTEPIWTAKSAKPIDWEEAHRYHTMAARATLYPGKTIGEVEAIIENDIKSYREHVQKTAKPPE